MSAQHHLDDNNVPGYLVAIGILRAGDAPVVAPAGDGNINWVRRVRVSDGRSWIVKQARRNLEKFPHYTADTARLVYESRYLDVARACDQGGVLPAVLHFDEANRILILQDIGEVPHMGELLIAGAGLDAELVVLAGFLARVHEATRGQCLEGRFRNDQMRRLHGDHIFVLPFRPNDFDLAPPMAARAAAMWKDAALVERADRAYLRYLEPHGVLVHADVQSSNVLITKTGPVLLDAEIAHVGDPAFDLGTLVAHVYLPALTRDEVSTAEATTSAIYAAYRAEGPVRPGFTADVEEYAAIEMIRRTIGAARLPAMEDPDAALLCLDLAGSVVRGDAQLIRDLVSTDR